VNDIEISQVTNDIVFTNNFDMSIVDGISRVAQQIFIRLKLFKGEWYLDETFGVPYFEDIFRKRKDFGLVSTIFKSQILSVPNVDSLLSFDLEIDEQTRLMTIDFSVNTAFGTIESSQVI